MKTIIEITHDSKTSYAMPYEVYEVVVCALDLRLAKGMNRALALLPEAMREGVKITQLPKEPDGMRGLTASVIIVNEVAELTDAEAAALALPNTQSSATPKHGH